MEYGDCLNGGLLIAYQARHGHTNIETTLQTYVHDTEKMGEQSVALFEQATPRKLS